MKFRAVLSALLLAAGLVFVTGCDSPEKAYKEWSSAVLKGDVAAAKARSTKAAEKGVEMLVEMVKQDAKSKENLEKSKIVSCTKDGDTATVEVKDASGNTAKFKMAKEDGKWKVGDIK